MTLVMTAAETNISTNSKPQNTPKKQRERHKYSPLNLLLRQPMTNNHRRPRHIRNDIHRRNNRINRHHHTRLIHLHKRPRILQHLHSLQPQRPLVQIRVRRVLHELLDLNPKVMLAQ